VQGFYDRRRHYRLELIEFLSSPRTAPYENARRLDRSKPPGVEIRMSWNPDVPKP
jgi:hypothetical protein